MTTYFFAKRADLDTEVSVSADRWYDARAFAHMLLGDDVIWTTVADDGIFDATFELKWTGHAVRSSSELVLNVRKRRKDGKWGTWRKL